MISKNVLALVVVLLLVAPVALAQETCNGNFDCDQDVDGTDAASFKASFGRSEFNDPCPTCNDSPCPCNPCPYGMVDCGTKCVAPMTDEDFCGVDLDCVGGMICGASERCVIGVCEIVGEVVYQTAVPKTGQTTSYATGDDGDLEKGVQWPYPRFTDNGDGTVLDNLTGLMWLKDANCFGTRTWNNALSDSNGLADGSCGLTDGTSAGDWRLPNRRELFSLIHDDYFNLAVPDTTGSSQWSGGDPFNNVQPFYYWSSTTVAGHNLHAWGVDLNYGFENVYYKTDDYYVWPVRGGH